MLDIYYIFVLYEEFCMTKLEDVEIYVDDKGEYHLHPEEGFTKIDHKDLYNWTTIYAFSSTFLTHLFARSVMLFTDPNIAYFRIKEESPESTIILLVNRDADGGIQDYEDLRNFRITVKDLATT